MSKKMVVVLRLEFDGVDCESDEGIQLVETITEDCRMIRLDYDASVVFVDDVLNVEAVNHE